MSSSSSVHLLPLYDTEPCMFEADGRHFKSFCGKDYLDHLLAHCEAGMVKVSLDAEDRLADHDNRLTAVEGRVDLVRTDLVGSHQRINVVVARASEDGDAQANERFVILFIESCQRLLV